MNQVLIDHVRELLDRKGKISIQEALEISQLALQDSSKEFKPDQASNV